MKNEIESIIPDDIIIRLRRDVMSEELLQEAIDEIKKLRRINTSLNYKIMRVNGEIDVTKDDDA